MPYLNMQMKFAVSVCSSQKAILFIQKTLNMMHKSYPYFVLVLSFNFWWTVPLRSSTHTPTQRLRITVIHSWIAFRLMSRCLFFHSPWDVQCFSSSGYQQLSPTNRNPHHTWSSSFLAGRSFLPLSSHCFCEWENGLQLLFDLFWLWRKIYKVFIVIFGPARLYFIHSQRPPPLLTAPQFVSTLTMSYLFLQAESHRELMH